MEKGTIQVYYGLGLGKTNAAIGQCMKEAGKGAQVIVIQFLKGKDVEEYKILNRLEPEIKLFRFEKEQGYYKELTESQKEDEKSNILNGFNFAKKVLETRGCDVLFLDEILGLLDLNIITEDELISLIHLKAEECDLILTGRVFPENLKQYVDVISEIHYIKG